jgi:hypothetical protein
MPQSTQQMARAMVVGGWVAGTIDVGAASLINWLSPAIILRAIASGLLGKSSFDGGAKTAILGYALQCGMSILIAAVFVTAARSLSFLRARWILAGSAFGVVVFFVMEYVVVPLSAVGQAPHFHIASFLENLLAMIVFGIIIAYFARARSMSR